MKGPYQGPIVSTVDEARQETGSHAFEWTWPSHEEFPFSDGHILVLLNTGCRGIIDNQMGSGYQRNER